MAEPDHARARLRQLLGIADTTGGRFELLSAGRETRDGFALERLVFEDAAGARIPALLSLPADAPPPWPAVLYCHAHGGRYDIGKAELTDGRPALAGPYAPALADIGVAALAIDLPTFGERAAEQENALAKALLWRGRTLFGVMLAELGAALDWLRADPRFDPTRIGAMGLSMGSTLAWWLGALDERIAAVAELCCLADLATLVDSGAHDRHGLYMTVPGLLGEFSTGDIAGLIAPRPHLSCVGLADPLTPPDGVAKVDAALTARYAALGAPRNWRLHAWPDIGHQETPPMRALVLDFLRQELVGDRAGG